ncbi:MAG: fibronectin type III domain-containing protein [Verrucomicrobia bacterium]|nr:fibronectin type III domain-containing protein [Verrucomicrobiota bacterium]
MLNDGGVAFVWQGGSIGMQEIYLRILGSNGIFATGDLLVNTYTNQQQAHPVIACLNDGNLVVAWSSQGQDGSLQGVYAKVISPEGVSLSSDLQVNQTTHLNQRNPSVAALADGNFVLVWASERLSGVGATNAGSHVVDIMGRVFSPVGLPLSDEFQLSALDAIGSQPSVAARESGGFLVAWGQLTPAHTNSWDIYARAFDVNNSPISAPVVVNTYRNGDQFAPKLASHDENALVVWTSLGQDGSHDGVFGRLLTSAGDLAGNEIQINTTSINRQIQPTVAADETGRFLVAWSSFIGGTASLDLFAQRYVVQGENGGLYPPDSPYISALSSTELSVTWPELSGYPVAFYELHMDGGLSSPMIVTGMQIAVINLSPGTHYTFRLLYELTDGRRSPLSAPVEGRTWGEDLNGDGLPDDWQASIWGDNPADWPAGDTDSDGDGASNFAEFLAGTNPMDAASVLKTHMQRTLQGMRFSWNTQLGFVYQVQRASNLTGWSNVGTPRFAYGNFDLIQISAEEDPAFYRVICLR